MNCYFKLSPALRACLVTGIRDKPAGKEFDLLTTAPWGRTIKLRRTAVDQCVGDLLNTLVETGLATNTVYFFPITGKCSGLMACRQAQPDRAHQLHQLAAVEKE